jgi:hypothetical protein
MRVHSSHKVPHMHKPLSSVPPSFSDSQVDQLLFTLRPLNEAQREALLEDLASVLREAPRLGDGQLYRTLRDLQRRHFDPPIVAAGAGASRQWER